MIDFTLSTWHFAQANTKGCLLCLYPLNTSMTSSKDRWHLALWGMFATGHCPGCEHWCLNSMKLIAAKAEWVWKRHPLFLSYRRLPGTEEISGWMKIVTMTSRINWQKDRNWAQFSGFECLLHLTSSSLSYFICKMGLVIDPSLALLKGLNKIQYAKSKWHITCFSVSLQ